MSLLKYLKSKNNHELRMHEDFGDHYILIDIISCKMGFYLCELCTKNMNVCIVRRIRTKTTLKFVLFFRIF